MTIRWDAAKNAKLKAERGFGFEDVMEALGEGGFLGDEENLADGRSGQRVLYVRMKDYAVAVPYITDGEDRILKTAFLSRKATRRYLRSN